jgi:hypothetical protein
MDLLSEIRAKIQTLQDHSAAEGLRAAVRHVEVAERWLLRARDEQDDDLLNDVVYRTNQAFEGMLKEAYSLFTGADAAKLRPYDIEQYFLENEVLTQRALQLFSNYRREWRNASTHDHRLLFKEQEALLAIVSVSAFSAILLDQIVERVSFEQERRLLEERKESLQREVAVTESTPVHDQILGLLIIFGKELAATAVQEEELRQVEIAGRLAGFLQTLRPDLTVRREYQLPGEVSLRPDFVIGDEPASVVVEIKRTGYLASAVRTGHHQVLRYLEVAGLDHGILFIPPEPGAVNVRASTTEYDLGGKITFVHTVGPFGVPEDPNDF